MGPEPRHGQVGQVKLVLEQVELSQSCLHANRQNIHHHMHSIDQEKLGVIQIFT